MKNKLDVSENEKSRIRELVNEEKGLVTEAIWESRKIEAKRCQEDGLTLAYIGGTVTHKKMTIDGNTPEVGDFFVNRESRNGNLTNDWSGNNPAGSDGKTYKVTKVFSLNDGCMFCLTYNFPSAPKCDDPPVDPSWECINGVCADPGTGNGQYASQSDCNNNCVVPAYRCRDCNTPCSQQLIDAGACPYPTTAHCQAMCDDTNKWRCYRDKFGKKKCKKCKVYQMTDGTMCFNSKQECLDSDCGGELSFDDKSFETKGGVQLDNPILSPSDDSPISFGGGSEELSKSRKINESDLRRIIGKITKG